MFTLKFNTTNDAFRESLSDEVARILKKIAERVSNTGLAVEEADGLITDTNGNIIGSWEYVP